MRILVVLMSIVYVESSFAAERELALLKQNCIACHGGVANGRKVTEGDFDIAELLNAGIASRHSSDWARVVEMVREEAMPPDDSDLSLSASERKSIVTAVFSALDRKDIPHRVMTAREISNTTAELFRISPGIYDSFEELRSVTVPDARYETTDARRLMTAAWIRELDKTLTKTIADLVDGQLTDRVLPTDRSRFELYFRPNGSLKEAPIYHAHLGDSHLKKDLRDALKAQKKGTPAEKRQAEQDVLNIRRRMAERSRPKKADRSPGVVDIRLRQAAELLATDDRPIPPGTYRLSFTATALNRDAVEREFRLGNKPKRIGTKKRELDPGKKEQWSELLHSRMRFQIMQRSWNQSTLKTSHWDLRGEPVETFEIEDNVAKKYECVVRSAYPFRLGVNWLNGPVRYRVPVERMYLGSIARQAHEAEDYQLPCIRITSEIVLERLPEEAPEIPFRLTTSGPAAERQARAHLIELMKQLSLTQSSRELVATYAQLRKDLPVSDSYLDALKLVLMSRENLYLSLDDTDDTASARFISYSLLKHAPTPEFILRFKAFREGEIDAAAFTRSVINDPKFNHFLDTLVDGWLERWADLDITQFSRRERNAPYKEETLVYLTHLFTENRPAAELFVSDYRFVNASLATFYEMDDRAFGHNFERVAATNRGGLLSQGMFYVARSDGIDPRPFNRAKWIVENAFGEHISEPPGDINSDQFFATEEEMTFKQRTQMHAKNEVCASCHSKLDPVAFSMHNFDTLGRPVGEQDETVNAALLTRLKSDDEPIARSFTQNLIACIVGRDPNIYDMRVVDEIVTKTKATRHRVTDILALIIENYFANAEG